MAKLRVDDAHKDPARRSQVASHWLDESGLSTAEYVIVLALIAICAIAAWRGFGASVRSKVQAGTEGVEGLEGASGGSGSGAHETVASAHESATGGGHQSSGAAGSSGSSGAGANGTGSGAGNGTGTAGGAANGTNTAGNAVVANGANGAAGAGAAGANQAGGARSGTNANNPNERHTNVTTASATDSDAAIAQLDAREQEEVRQRRLMAFGVAGVCLLVLIAIGARNYYVAKKEREKLEKERELKAKQAAMQMDTSRMSGVGTIPPAAPSTGAGASDGGAVSLSDITIPPPPMNPK
jgi:Flp pilus assembly pilin Flp